MGESYWRFPPKDEILALDFCNSNREFELQFMFLLLVWISLSRSFLVSFVLGTKLQLRDFYRHTSEVCCGRSSKATIAVGTIVKQLLLWAQH